MRYRACLLVSILVCPGASAQDAPAEPRVQQIVTRALELYGSAETFQQSAYESSFQDVDDQEDPRFNSKGIFASQLYFARPNRFAIISRQYECICDGKHVWIHDKISGNYSRKPVPAQMGVEQLAYIDRFPSLLFDHAIVLDMLLSGKVSFTGGIPGSLADNATRVAKEEVDSRAGYRVYQASLSMRAPDSSFWFDQNGYLVELRSWMAAVPIDLDESTGDAIDSSNLSILEHSLHLTVTRYSDIKLNASIEADRFTFTPGPEDHLVDSWIATDP